MNAFPKFSYIKWNTGSVPTKQFEQKCDESVFCTEDNLEESLHELSEELSSLDISSITLDNNDDLQSAESLKQMCVKTINSTWDLIHKYKLLTQQYKEADILNHKTRNDNAYFKNQITRLKEDLQKKEQTLCRAQEKERRLKSHLENVSLDLKHEKDETRKLRKQAQSKDIQHEHEVKRILQVNQKLHEHLQKSNGAPRGKALQKVQTDQEKELASYKKTVCRMEDNNRQLLEQINKLNESLELHKGAIDLQMQASGGWTDVD